MDVIEHTTRWLCPEHPAVAVELPEPGDRCVDCGGPLVEVDFVVVPATDHQGAVDAERKRVAEYLRGRGSDCWDPGVEAALQQVADEIARDHHHGGR